jgi:hypothetical protein
MTVGAGLLLECWMLCLSVLGLMLQWRQILLFFFEIVAPNSWRTGW